MTKYLAMVMLFVLASCLPWQKPHAQVSQSFPLAGSNGGTFARDKAAEDVIARSLIKLLTARHITGTSRYFPTLLSEGVCSSILKGSWVSMMSTDEGPSAFYKTDDISQPSNDLLKMVKDIANHYKPMRRYAVSVWREKLANGSSRYWVGIVLAKSPVSDWFGSHLGADTPQEMAHPNYVAKRDISPTCRQK
ncbi:MAG TPA: hypothetical protein VFW25_07995 [Silvibacterium sp.]|nr:hypothetical protein [Silvibacterium sp.]